MPALDQPDVEAHDAVDHTRSPPSSSSDSDDDAHEDDPAFRRGAALVQRVLEVAVGGGSGDTAADDTSGIDNHAMHQVAYARALSRVAARTFVRGAGKSLFRGAGRSIIRAARKVKRLRTVATKSSDVAVAIGEGLHHTLHGGGHNPSTSSAVHAAPAVANPNPPVAEAPRSTTKQSPPATSSKPPPPAVDAAVQKLPGWLHVGAASLMWGYVVGDVAWSVLQVHETAERNALDPPPTRAELATVAGQQLLFHGLATVVIPEFAIGKAAAAGKGFASRYLDPAKNPRLVRWMPALAAISVVPVLPTLVDEPTELATGMAFDTLRRRCGLRTDLLAHHH